jgi:hypothetical protein
MKRKRPEAGDHDNDAFEFVDRASHHVKAGFDAGEEVSPQKGEEQFPHRRREEEVPKGSLADRIQESQRGK